MRRCVKPNVFGLKDPPRTVIDLSGMRSLNAPAADGAVTAVRFAYKAEVDTGRAVLQLRAPMHLNESSLLESADGCLWRGTMTTARANAPVVPDAGRKPKKLTVVLDPGHGGNDPGASHGAVQEKELTLITARLVASHLHAKLPNVKIIMTRNSDKYVSLADRSAEALRARADWFISLHADSLPDDPAVRGASVYTLSDTASDEAAAALAQSENAVDLLPADAPAGDVANILLSLAQDKVNRRAEVLADRLAKRLRVDGGASIAHTHRRAGFRVLKTAGVPSLLIELGYLSNRHDRELLLNPKSRESIAETIAAVLADEISRTAAAGGIE